MMHSKFIAAILLVGGLTSIFDDKPVDLLEHDLIDLNKAIDFAQFGDEYEAGEGGTAEADDSDSVTPAVVNDNLPTRVTFRIRGKELFYTVGRTLNKKTDISQVESIIHESEKVDSPDAESDKLTVVLVDDYADSKTYKEADAIIESLKGETEFVYEER